MDNYDSVVYKLVQYLGELGADPLVHRHDDLALDEIVALDPDAVLISPGPGRPEDAGLSNQIIEHFAGRRPVLGVCLGHQCIGQVFGGEVVRAPEIMHGKTSVIHQDGTGVFAGLPDPFEAARVRRGILGSVADALLRDLPAHPRDLARHVGEDHATATWSGGRPRRPARRGTPPGSTTGRCSSARPT